MLRVLIREERFPPAIRNVVPPHKLDLFRPDTILDFIHADLARAHIPTARAKVLHPGEGELAEIAILDASADERHRDVALDTIDARPGRDEGEDAGDKIDERVGRVVLVAAGAPELVQAGAADDEGGVDLEAVGAEGRVVEVLAELVQVALEIDVGQVGHHVADDLEAGVLGEGKGVGDGGNRVAAVGVAGDVFVEGLHANLEAGAAVAEHGGQVRLEAVVGPGFDGDADALDVAHLAGLDGLVDGVGLVAAEGVVELGDELFAVSFRQ